MPLINQVISKYKQQVTPLMQSVLMQLTNMTLNYVNSLPAQISSDILRISPQQIQNLSATVPILSSSTSLTSSNNINNPSNNNNNNANNTNNNIIINNNNNNNVLHFNTSSSSSSSVAQQQRNHNHTHNHNHQMNGTNSAPTTTTADEMDDMTISPDTQYVLDIQAMYKAYFMFLLNVINNDLMDVFLNHASNDIYRIYCALLQGVQIGTPDVSKACLQVIKKMISFFGKQYLFNIYFLILLKFIIKKFDLFSFLIKLISLL